MYLLIPGFRSYLRGPPSKKKEPPDRGQASTDEAGESSLERSLLELHVSESRREVQWSTHLNPCSNLLGALCRRQPRDRLVLALQPGNEGYSLHLVSNFPIETLRPVLLIQSVGRRPRTAPKPSSCNCLTRRTTS